MRKDYDQDPSEEQRLAWSQQQNDLKKQLALDDSRLSFETATLTDLKYVGGVDLSFPLGDHENAVACLVVMQMPDLQVVYKEFLQTKLHLPYISGYLAFREVEPLMELIRQLKANQPELYPQFGIASHLGVLCDTPTIGVAKNFLVIPSEFDDMAAIKSQYKEALHKKGDDFKLVGATSGSIYGTALRTSDNAVNPVFVSQGHLITLETAIKVVLATCPKHRIPEPIRAADLESRAYIRTNSSLLQ
ncbi:hypothetical protein MUCCIDRAFT_166063 [Mucor lusitanicus CBS 277.49]|uniref:Endonuclease V n=1 Tax=Mucor lusitanicus CBS 277.49 TaxID=747725 RepID=A0A168IRN4_MUCCL|nr:hypothetical protein MUCCIDRAFT_166063 [Mucor lusitanicus CBS 277.49]